MVDFCLKIYHQAAFDSILIEHRANSHRILLTFQADSRLIDFSSSAFIAIVPTKFSFAERKKANTTRPTDNRGTWPTIESLVVNSIGMDPEQPFLEAFSA